MARPLQRKIRSPGRKRRHEGAGAHQETLNRALAETRILEMVKKLWVLPVDIRLSAHTNKLRFRPRSYSYLGEVPTLDVFEAPITDWDLVMKWLFDHVVGFVILVLALPVMGVALLLVRLTSRGPGIYTQTRLGAGGIPFRIFNIRTMVHNCESLTGPRWAVPGDPRVAEVADRLIALIEAAEALAEEAATVALSTPARRAATRC